MRRPAAILAAAVTLSACAPTRVAPPPVAPDSVEPAAALPGDLDVVVRVDLARMRHEIGPLASLAVEGSLRAAEEDPVGERVLRDVLAGADTIWIALRPAETAAQVDWALVARGRFSTLRPRDARGPQPWGLEADLGGDWHRVERARTPRSAPAALWRRGDGLVVVASVAEIDAIERTVERGERGGGPTAPERGVLALAARGGAVRAAVRSLAPSLAGALAPVRGVTATLDVRGDDARLVVELECAAARTALQLSRELSAPIQRVAARLGEAVRVVGPSAVATRVAVELSAPLGALGALVGS